jgi:hypothetical protein
VSIDSSILRQFGDQLRIERIAPIGARERDPEDVAVAVGAQVRHRRQV